MDGWMGVGKGRREGGGRGGGGDGESPNFYSIRGTLEDRDACQWNLGRSKCMSVEL